MLPVRIPPQQVQMQLLVLLLPRQRFLADLTPPPDLLWWRPKPAGPKVRHFDLSAPTGGLSLHLNRDIELPASIWGPMAFRYLHTVAAHQTQQSEVFEAQNDQMCK